MLQRQVTVEPGGNVLDPVDQQVGLERVPCARGRDRAEGERPVDGLPNPLGAPEEECSFLKRERFRRVVPDALPLLDRVPEIDGRNSDVVGRGQRDDRLGLRVRDLGEAAAGGPASGPREAGSRTPSSA